MYNTQYASVIRSDCRSWRSRLHVGSTYIYDIESISFTNGSQAGNNVTVGSVVAPSIAVTLTNLGSVLTGSVFIWELGILKDLDLFDGDNPDTDYEYIPMGQFKVTAVKKNGTRWNLECTHKLAQSDVPHASALTFPTTAQLLMQEVVNSLDMTFSQTLSPSVSIEGIPAGATKRDIIGWIAALYGGFACADRSGNVVVKWYVNSQYTLPADALGSPEIAEQQVTYTAVQCSAADGLNYITGSGTAMTFNCPFMTDNQWNRVSASLINFSYRPVKVSMLLGDPLIDPWDIVTLSYNNTNYIVPAASLTVDHKGGVSGSIEVKGGDTQSTSRVDPITKAVDRLVEMINENTDEIEQDIADAIEQATEQIRGGANGYFFIVDDNGVNRETIWSDNVNPAQATHGIRINKNGIGFWVKDPTDPDSNLFDGPYTQAWTIDGNLVADFIKAGTLSGITIICDNGTIGGWDITQSAIVSPDNQVRLDSTYETPAMTHAELRASNKKNSDLTDYTHEQIRYLDSQATGKAQVSAMSGADSCALRDGKIVVERAGAMQLEVSADAITSGMNGGYIAQSTNEILSDVGDVEHIYITRENPNTNVLELVAEWWESPPSSWTPINTPGCWYLPELYVSENVHSNRIDVHTAAYVEGLVQARALSLTYGGINVKGRYDAYTPADQIRNHAGINFNDPDGVYLCGIRAAEISNEQGIAMSYPSTGDLDFVGLWDETNTSSSEKYYNLIAGFFRNDNTIKIRKPVWARNNIVLTRASGTAEIEGLTLNNRKIYFYYNDTNEVGQITMESSNSIDTKLVDGSKIRWTIGSASTTSSVIMEYMSSDDQLHIRRDTNLHNNDLLNAVISSSSDERLKDNIAPCDKDCLSIINALKLIKFNWKDGHGHEDIGFSAQQAGSVSPDLRGEADGYGTVREGRLIRYLVGAVQQLTKEVEELKNGTKSSENERE